MRKHVSEKGQQFSEEYGEWKKRAKLPVGDSGGAEIELRRAAVNSATAIGL